MRVLHAVPSIGPLRGGMTTAVSDMCRWQASAGIDVTLVTTNDNGPGYLDVPLEKPIPQSGYSVWYFSRTTRVYTFCASIAPWLVRHVSDFDLVHVHGVFSYMSTITTRIARARGVPYIVTPHGILGGWGMQHRRPRLKLVSIALVERPALNHASLVHATSSTEACELSALGIHAPIENISLGLEAPSPSDDPRTALETRWPALHGHTVVLFLGRIDPKKGLDVLLPAFQQARVAAPDLYLLLAGEGKSDYTAQLKTLVAQLNLEDQIVYTGHLHGPDKQAALSGADMVIMPSYSESFGLVAAEAMAAETPVILSDGVAIHDVVSRTGAGRVVPTGKVAPLASALVELAHDPDLRQTMGKSGRLAAAHFSPDVVTREMLEAYQRACLDQHTGVP